MNALITSVGTKLQIRLDEDATKEQVLVALESSLVELNRNLSTGTRLKQVVGQILVRIRDEKLYTQPTFTEFLIETVEGRHGISKAIAYEAMGIVEHLHLTPTQASRIRQTNINLIVRAVKQAAPERKEKLEKTLLEKGAKMPVKQFQAFVHRAHLIRKPVGGETLATLTFQVPASVAESWRRVVGDRRSSDVFAEMVRGCAKQKVA